MKAFFWGANGRRLFAVHHAPQGSSGASATAPAVLVCTPFGQEAVRAHRLVRIVSERLAQRGQHVLRFDPYGSGDSEGADEALDLSGWVADVLGASAQLNRLSSGVPQVWLGFRLGASVACRAARQAAAGNQHPGALTPQSLSLCEPVLEGQAYLQELALATVQTLEASCSIRDPQWRVSLREAPHVWAREALGFTMGDIFFQQLSGLRAQHVTAPPGTPIRLIVPELASAASESAKAWCAGQPQAQCIQAKYQFDWTAEEAVNRAIVPQALLTALLASLGAPTSHG